MFLVLKYVQNFIKISKTPFSSQEKVLYMKEILHYLFLLIVTSSYICVKPGLLRWSFFISLGLAGIDAEVRFRKKQYFSLGQCRQYAIKIPFFFICLQKLMKVRIQFYNFIQHENFNV